MNADQLEDLKQFITATVSQALANTATKDDLANLATKNDLEALRTEMREGFTGVGVPVAQQNDELADHEQRISKLEHQAV